jgi:CHAD domain-containing protein
MEPYKLTFKFGVKDPSEASRALAIVQERFVRGEDSPAEESRSIIDVYHDTDDYQLYQMGIGLRERSDGSDSRLEAIVIPKKWDRGHYFTKLIPLGPGNALAEQVGIDPDQIHDALGVQITGQLRRIVVIKIDRVQQSVAIASPVDRSQGISPSLIVTQDAWSVLQDPDAQPSQDTTLQSKVGQQDYVFHEVKIETWIASPTEVPDDANALVEAFKNEKGFKMLTKCKLTAALDVLGASAVSKPKLIVYDSDSQGVFLRDSLSYFLQDAFSNEPGTLPNLDPEFFHSFRVGLRRCRSILATFKQLVVADKYTYFQTDWRWLMLQVGEVWNLNVFRAKLCEMIPRDLIESHRAEFDALIAALEGQQAAKWQELVETFTTPRYSRIKHDSLAFARTPGIIDSTNPRYYAPARDLGTGRVMKFHDFVVDTCKKLLPNFETLEDRNVHLLRIEFKKLRYLIEMFSSILPPKIVRINEFMEIQEAFGVFTDLFFSIAKLGEYVERPEFASMIEAFSTCLELVKTGQKSIIKDRLLSWLQGLQA